MLNRNDMRYIGPEMVETTSKVFGSWPPFMVCSNFDHTTSEPRQHPLDVEHPPYEEDNLSKDQAEQDNEELPKLETQVPVLC